jgi:DNA-binding NarL/FixJ family response regulator
MMAINSTVDARRRVAVVDDDADTRFFFKDVLESAKGFRFAGDFPNAREALRGIPQLRPDLAVMDIRMPGLNGIECTRQLKRDMPRLKIVIITGTHNTDAVNTSLLAGADAYLIKPIDADQFLATLQFATVGGTEAGQSAQKSGQNVFPSAPSGNCARLSPREKQVLENLADGLLYKEISDKLGISYAAVHKYQHIVFQKLQVSNRSEAIRLWLDSDRK